MLLLGNEFTIWMMRDKLGHIQKEFEVKLIEPGQAVREEVKSIENELQGKLDLILEFMKENKNK